MADADLQPGATPASQPFRVGFLVVDNFTLVALSTAIEPLRMANQLSGERLYEWSLISNSVDPVRSSDGVEVTPDATVESHPRLDLLLVVAGIDVAASYAPAHIAWLKKMAKTKIAMGGVCTGAYVLARAGLLDGYACSAHWECLSALQEEFPRVNTNNQLFSFDRDRITCTGGDVPIHMMMNLVSHHHGQPLANAISDMFVCERIREGHEPQRLMMEHQLSANHPKLADAVQLMQANLEEPLELSVIAELSGVSRRQLERLFLGNLGFSPSRFYLKLRLEKAQQLLRQTAHPIVDIAVMCGFISATHFSRCYRKYMGRAPKAERDLKARAAPAEAGETCNEAETPAPAAASSK